MRWCMPPRSADPSPAEWYDRACSSWQRWQVDALLSAKGEHRVSVVIPARTEAGTIGAVVSGIRAALIDMHPLVDELVVIDSDSTDATATVARDAGATVFRARDIRPDLGTYPGKGEALWKSQFVTTGDLLVFVDADLTGWGPHFVSGLVGPLLDDPDLQLVKGFYDRLLDDGSEVHTPQGGRVTELVARPLINLWWPVLARVVQPLAGEWAIRRSAFERLAVPVGYGVELAALVDVHAEWGLDAIAQVDLGERAHSHQSVHDLGLMAAELVIVASRRRGDVPAASELWQFDRNAEPTWRARPVPYDERPPAGALRGSADGGLDAEAG